MRGKETKIDSCPNQLQSQSSPGGLGCAALKGMVSSGKVSCGMFVMHVEYLLVHVVCVLIHVLVGVNVSEYI